jgi:serine protease
MNRRLAEPRPALALFLLGLAVLVGLADLHAQRFARPRRPLNPQASGALPPSKQSGDAPLRQAPGTRAAALADASARGLAYVPGEVLVKFRHRSTRWGRQRALAVARSRASIDDVRWIGDMALVRDPTQPDSVALAQRLREQGDVEFAEPNYVRRVAGAPSGRWVALREGASPAGVPNDTDYGELQWNFDLIDMPRAWDINPGGSPEIIVAVIDTGMTTQAGSITEPIWTGSEFEQLSLDFEVNPDFSPSRFAMPRDMTVSDPGAPVRDLSGHGTHVASTIAQETNNRLALAGIAYRVRLMPVKVCLGYWDLMIESGRLGIPGFPPPTAGLCSSGEVAAGIRYAVDNGARIINVSVSGSSPAQVERDALAYAASQGAFVTISGGNEFESGNPAQYPAGFAPSIDGVMSVAAVAKSRARADYSSTGTYIEIAAPGGIETDDGSEDFGFVWQVTLFPPDNLPSIRRPRFDRFAEVGYTGTSMAAPHVAGVAALLMSQGVTNPRAIESFLKAAATDIGPSGADTQFGHGLVNGRAGVFGMGVWR